MSRLSDWLDRLGYSQFPRALFQVGKSAGIQTYGAEVDEILSPTHGIGAQAVFCVEDVPLICFVDRAAVGPKLTPRIEQIRQRLWNQSLASVVLMVDTDAVTAFSVNRREAEPEVLPYDEAELHSRWSAYEVGTGFLADRLPAWFSPETRVDQRLLANLRGAVQRLRKQNLSDTQSEALMAQVIFICYLEQRGIIGESYRQAHNLETLNACVAKRDGRRVDRLLAQLGDDFNGDFLSGESSGAPAWSSLQEESFDVVEFFLQGVDLETGQGSLWRYDFSHIPVELISAVYETLLKDRQGELGAYYTPRHLANLVVNEAFQDYGDPSFVATYDGASGSGILLTTAFRKMLRAAQVREGRALRLHERIDLLQNNIFGNDIDPTACSITAFSLYLALLEGIEPADIFLLQSTAELKLPRLVGDGLNIRKGPSQGDFFSEANPFSGSQRFDVFICNPPWRESDDKDAPVWEEWLRHQNPPYPIGRRQIAAGFAFRALRSVRKGGVVTLIMPLNLLIGATRQSTEFRQRWLEEARIERIINFGDVRRLLFPAARHPCAVVRLRPRQSPDALVFPPDETIEYWTPKSDISLALGQIALHAFDRKMLAARDVYDKPYLLINQYWGERPDTELLQRLLKFGTVRTVMSSGGRTWVSGKGFHAPNQSNPDRELGILENLNFLSAERLPSEFPILGSDASFERVRDRFTIVASPGGKNGRLYSGPRVVFPDGLLEDFTVRAVYSEEPFAFQSSVAAIGSDVSDDGRLLKFVAAYLRSPLAAYLLVLTGYSVIGERPRIAIEDVENFPFCAPESHPNMELAETIVDNVSAIFDTLAGEPEWLRHHPYAEVKERLDELVFDYFLLSDADRILVDDVATVIGKSIQPASYETLATPLLRRPTILEMDAYVDTLRSELAAWRARTDGHGSLRIEAVVRASQAFFGAVRVSLDGTAEDLSQTRLSESAFDGIFADINSALRIELAEAEEDSLFKIPNVLIIFKDSFYFLKPMRRRFWLRRSALLDADRIVRTVQAAVWSSSLT